MSGCKIVKREGDSRRLAAGFPISGGVCGRRVLALVLERNRGNRPRLLKARSQQHPLYRVLKPQRKQLANADGLMNEYRLKRARRTLRVISHLSVCSGGMVFLRLRGSCQGRARSSRLPHQLSPNSGVWESLPLDGEVGRPRRGERERPR